ncbi:MAG: carboxypeptidase-like regulatory domain-containing protein [Planctomycetaceae bacterium]|nr:carboxypeptidase-like regulatory domain-containing protein [Planctomycetaceae bacterium]
MKYELSLLFAAVLIALQMTGCQTHARRDFSHLNLVEVSGTITLDGSPLPDVQVFFVDKKTNTHSYGQTNERGEYSLLFDSTKSGVTPGEKLVRITSLPQGEEAVSGEGRVVQAKDKVPAMYNKETTLAVSIDAGKNRQTFDFELKSAKEMSK